jgi:ribosome-binding protein aMBF1 (putative translation factor)
MSEIRLCPHCKEPEADISDCNKSDCQTMKKFNDWWYASKYMQVVTSSLSTRRIAIDAWQARDVEIDELRAKVKELEDSLETERLRLAACGTAALGYFEGCKEEYRSASLEDTLRLYAKVKELTENGQSLSDTLISSREEVADLRAKAKDTERLRELWLESTAKESELRTNLAQLLIEAREKCGLSLTVASAFLGISKGHLHDYESGKELNPTLKVLSAFVRVYGIDPAVLICADAAIAALEQHKEKP